MEDTFEPSYNAPPPNAGASRSNPFKTIELFPDGRYRWVYELDMRKNPAILITVFIVLLISFVITYLIVLCIGIFSSSSFGLDDALELASVFLIIIAVMAVITLVAYLIVAAINKGKYCVIFTLDDQGIEHRVLPKQFEKAQAIGMLSILAGMATGKPGMVGTGMIVASRDQATSTFDKVTSVIPQPTMNTILVNEPLLKNQVYVEDEDFEAVCQFILAHCPNATRLEVRA